jgi:hypothetical protein
MRQYFIQNGQNEEGPFDLEQLKLQTLKKDTPIWYEGLESWTTVGEIEELKSIFISKLTPPPFVKPTEVKATPPKTEQTSYASTSYEEAFPTKKRSLLVPLIIGGVIVVSGIVGWLVYQNSQHTATIDNLQEKVTTQDNAIQTQQTQETEKEAERLRINAANTAKNMEYRNNWDTYIKVRNSEPTIDYTLGGISGFNVYVSNETEYILDQVDVLVQYIRKNGQIWQSSTIHLFNVAPNSMERGIAPESVNGIKVSCSIEKVISNKMHFCYPSNNGNPEDPYFCK